MKTVGSIISEARIEKGYTLTQLSELTRIDPRYISAVEQDHYHLLPSITFAKGFIRNLAVTLEKNPDELVAIFRRDYHPQRTQIANNHSPIYKKNTLSLPVQYLPLVGGITIFLIYLVIQFRAVIIPPRLDIIQPSPESVLSSPVTIEGLTIPEGRVIINDEINIKPDQTGHFVSQVYLSPGSTNLEVIVTNRFNRSVYKTIPITVVSH